MPSAKIAIVGGGVAGATAALYLGGIGCDVTLFEKGPDLVSGPPFCHLHAGGNLYREISDEQCLTLLRESIDLLRFYPYAVDFRPTLITIPKSDSGNPEDLYPRLQRLQAEYEELIKKDPANSVLGSPENYYKVYDRESVEALRQREPVEMPSSLDEWMIPAVRGIDLDKIKFPLLMVQEYGLNLFRLGAGATLSLRKLKRCTLRLDTEVISILQDSEQSTFDVSYRHDQNVQSETFDYLINAAGFRAGEIDDMLGFKRERLVEFKAAYVTQWQKGTVWPEVIFHGERGTPMGMGQFTPYACGLVQLHGMTNEITLFEGGLVGTTPKSAQPPLAERFLKMIDQKWEWSIVEKRSRRAIEHIAQYIPAFRSAQVASKPLYGAQQIPGGDPTLRAADVSFEGDRYARCEIVKASSVLSMTDAIVSKLITLQYLDSALHGTRALPAFSHLDENTLQHQAATICESREYPSCLSKRVVSHP